MIATNVSFDVYCEGKRVGFIHQESKDDWTLHLDDMKYTLENELDILKDFVYNRYMGKKVTIKEV